jgi:cytochrome P450
MTRAFEAAESFRPERFEHDPSPLGFTPFGGGIRRCPGRFFVKYEILLFLFVLFQHHRPHIQATTTPTMDKPNVSPRDLFITLGP